MGKDKVTFCKKAFLFCGNGKKYATYEFEPIYTRAISNIAGNILQCKKPSKRAKMNEEILKNYFEAISKKN